MDETRLIIKTSIETIVKSQLGINCEVEYCDDVDSRCAEINQQYEHPFVNHITPHCTRGAFLAAQEGFPAYIIINDTLPDHTYICTAFHELCHLLDMFNFIAILGCTMDNVETNPLYISFNFFSEYMATRYGLEHYMKYVSFPDIPNERVAECLARYYQKRYYQSLLSVINKYEYAYHTLSYIAAISLLADFSDELDCRQLTSDIIDLYIFDKFVEMFDQNSKDKDWYMAFDAALREYIG